jgi:5-enolpyruvylshikimate-3-phosphate synthase
LTRKDNVKIGPIGQFENEKTFVNILSKFGVNATIQKIGSAHYYAIQADKLNGRKIDEHQMRTFPEAFGPLSILAAFAKDKTILRGLPTSSSLWQGRISGVAETLSTAGVRIGEVEDGFVIEPPKEFADISYREFDDPYLQLVQLTAAIVINSKPLTAEFFSAYKYYPHFQTCLDKIRPRAKSLAS